MALVPPFPYSAEDIRGVLLGLRNDFSVAVHAPGNAFAVGAIIRTAHSFLAREIFIVGDAPFYEKAAMGMEKYETIVRCADDAAFLSQIEGRPLFAIEKDAARRSLTTAGDFPKGVVFLFGSERFGLPAAMLERADDVLGIPMYGVNHSFPVTVAAGIVMHEWARRRYVAGTTL